MVDDDIVQSDEDANEPNKSRVVVKTDPLPVIGSERDPALIAAIRNHIEHFIGPVENVLREKKSSHVHVDIHHVSPAVGRPFHTLITSGMSERGMNVEEAPPAARNFRYAELIMRLPPSWPLADPSVADYKAYWPIIWLQNLARYPHEYRTWFWYGHSMPLAHLDPHTGTDFEGVVLLEPRLLPEEARRLQFSKDKTIYFWGLYPVFAEEMKLKLRAGVEELERLFEENGITELLNVQRKNVAKKRFWLF